MAQKAFKTLAARNGTILDRTHLIALGVHGFFLLIHSLFRERSLILWSWISLPSFVIEYWFERSSRPTYKDGELKRPGDDLEAKGLTEWLWDVLYWSWGCVVLAGIFGDKAWWAMLAVPVYSVYLAITTFYGARSSLAGLGGAADTGASTGVQSKRQAKMEKRGGQKVQYR